MNKNWFTWALLSAFFPGLTAVLAKVGVAHVNSNLATAIRTVMILIFAWSVALFTSSQPISRIGGRTWVFLAGGPLKPDSCLSAEVRTVDRVFPPQKQIA